METEKRRSGVPWWKVLLLALVIVILPQLFIYYLRADSSDTFYRYVDENRQDCLERSERDQFPRQICIEAARQASEAYSAARGETAFVLPILLGLNFALGFGILILNRQVQRSSESKDTSAEAAASH